MVDKLMIEGTDLGVLLKRGTENGTENETEGKTEWNGKYAIRYT